MTLDELREKWFSFWKERGHAIIQSASLIPENDPTVLFTTAGMHPLVPYLLGQGHPAGSRLCDVQKCVRTGDIDDVGDSSHLTFFEMLGNWSLGDYFKKEAIHWSWEFLTGKDYLGIDPERLAFSVFAGDEDCKNALDAMIYQTAQEIGKKAVTLKGDVNAIILTGGIAHSKYVTDVIRDYVSSIAPVYVYPGEHEMESLGEQSYEALIGKAEVFEL